MHRWYCQICSES